VPCVRDALRERIKEAGAVPLALLGVTDAHLLQQKVVVRAGALQVAKGACMSRVVVRPG
jgi:hypothetical protein